jgi:hypothetical protein
LTFGVNVINHDKTQSKSIPVNAALFTEHARRQHEGEDGRAEHDGRAVGQRNVLDRVEHAQEEKAAEHSLQHWSRFNENFYGRNLRTKINHGQILSFSVRLSVLKSNN